MKRLIIGIDPGVHTGIAVWDPDDKTFVLVESAKALEAMNLVKSYWSKGLTETKLYHEIKLVIEDARLRKWFGNKGKEVAQGVGSVKRDCQLWEDFGDMLSISYELIPPKKNRTKTSEKEFRVLTRWEKRTNEHARDAAMLVWGRQ